MADNRSDTDQIIDAVLQAEQEARDAIAACQTQAKEILEEARARARAIQERTDRRITGLHNQCARATDQKVERLLQEDGEARQQPLEEQDTSRLLDTAVKRLAALLTGGEDEPPPGTAS